jgi:hypothetical protein
MGGHFRQRCVQIFGGQALSQNKDSFTNFLKDRIDRSDRPDVTANTVRTMKLQPATMTCAAYACLKLLQSYSNT